MLFLTCASFVNSQKYTVYGIVCVDQCTQSPTVCCRHITIVILRGLVLAFTP
jgi:hypothetical protein